MSVKVRKIGSTWGVRRAVAYSKMQDKNKTIADLKTASNYGHEKAKETLANLQAG